MKFFTISLIMLIVTFNKSYSQYDVYPYTNSPVCEGEKFIIGAGAKNQNLYYFYLIDPHGKEYPNDFSKPMKEEYEGTWWIMYKQKDTQYEGYISMPVEMKRNTINFDTSLKRELFDVEYLCANSSYSRTFKIKNTGNEYHKITKFELKNAEDYELVLNSKLPFTLRPKDSLSFDIKLKTNFPKYYSDELIVEIEELCSEIKIFDFRVKVNRTYTHSLSIGDTAVYEGDPVSLPLKLKLDNIYADTSGVECKVLIEYEPLFFVPDESHNLKRGLNDEYLIEVDAVIKASKDTIILGEIKGKTKNVTAANNANFHIYDFINDFNCTTTEFKDGKAVVIPLSVNEKDSNRDFTQLNDLTSFSAYPNPAEDHLTVEINSEEPGPVTIQLMDLLGNVIDSRRINNYNSNFIEEFNIHNLSQGTFFIKVITGSGVGVSKIIIK